MVSHTTDLQDTVAQSFRGKITYFRNLHRESFAEPPQPTPMVIEYQTPYREPLEQRPYTHTVDGQNPAPPKKCWNDDSPQNTNEQGFPMVAKWCRMYLPHRPIYCDSCLHTYHSPFPSIDWVLFNVREPSGSLPSPCRSSGQQLWRSSMACISLPLRTSCPKDPKWNTEPDARDPVPLKGKWSYGLLGLPCQVPCELVGGQLTPSLPRLLALTRTFENNIHFARVV